MVGTPATLTLARFENRRAPSRYRMESQEGRDIWPRPFTHWGWMPRPKHSRHRAKGEAFLLTSPLIGLYNKNDRHYKSAKELIQILADVASKGGNFLLDVGPTPQGTIQPEFAERLRAMGQWLKLNGDSIYDTTYGPMQNLSFGKITSKGSTVYLHVFTWPAAGTIQLPGFKSTASEVQLLATHEKLQFSQDSAGVSIHGPAEAQILMTA